MACSIGLAQSFAEKSIMPRVVDVTVGIATLDRPDGLARCLDAVLAGCVLPAQIVIVDQGQDKVTQSVVEQRQVEGVPIIYARQHKLGLSASRNAAIEGTHSPIVAFTDDDCIPDQHWIGAIERAFVSMPSPDAVTGRILPYGPQVPSTHVVSPRDRVLRGDFRGKTVPWLIGSGGNFAIRREWFARIGRYDERLGAGSSGRAAEDSEFFYRLLCAGGRIRYEPDAIVYHQRQTKAQRLTSRRNYGFGIGAFCGILFRRRDPYALYILGYWFFSLTREFAASITRRDSLGAYQRLLGFQGTVRGLIYGLAYLQ
jgi:GT2 family glycosyltransferase